LARARYQGPSPLGAVLVASRGRTPSASRAARRRRGGRECHVRTQGKLEATEQTRKDAEAFPRQKTNQITAEKYGGKQFLGPAQERVTVDQILDDLVTHYRRGGKLGHSPRGQSTDEIGAQAVAFSLRSPPSDAGYEHRCRQVHPATEGRGRTRARSGSTSWTNPATSRRGSSVRLRRNGWP
jgi:hypothetical protein